ncbi:MAG: tRNA (adenosine(37)-N6)-dimethylallyltransferase MiaA [Candidatus Nanopelagicales bacterium]
MNEPAPARSQQRPPIIAVVGPTAVGKSRLSLELAQRFNGEIINADSMQLYRGMDIGTAKLPVGQRRGIPHHLLDVWDLAHLANVAEYQQLARTCIDEVQAQGKLPILVGGSGLYVKAVIDDLQFPGTAPEVRQRLEARLEDEGSTALHHELGRLDPLTATRIPEANSRRVIRALEVIEITGELYSASLPTDRPFLSANIVALDDDREVLYQRIEARVEQMWNVGLVDEVRRLSEEQGLALAPTASRALGYAQVLDLLAGRCDEVTAKQATVIATRRFSRRQRSWFAKHARTTAFSASEPRLVDDVVSHVGSIVQ